jgi:hypothetical protein
MARQLGTANNMTPMWPATVSCLAVALALAACGEGEVYTLYRNSPVEAGARVHFATFDAKQSRG